MFFGAFWPVSRRFCGHIISARDGFIEKQEIVRRNGDDECGIYKRNGSVISSLCEIFKNMGSMSAGLRKCLSQVSMMVSKMSTSGEQAWLDEWHRC